MKIESIKLKNFRAFKDCEINDIPTFSIVVGANGAGKTTLFDLFAFLKDCFTENLNNAFSKRGGFKEVVTRGEKGPIEIELQYRVKPGSPLMNYFLSIKNEKGAPIVAKELLVDTEEGSPLLKFSAGEGYVAADDSTGHMIHDSIELYDNYDYMELYPGIRHKLAHRSLIALKIFSQFKDFDFTMPLATFIENWHLSEFHINSARQVQAEGYSEHLSREGENLALVTRFLYENHRSIFNTILERLKECVPGIESVTAKVTEEGRVLLKFHDGSFIDPFLARYVSDGTIKMFAYLVLLYDPSPYPLLCVEEPENQLYPKLLAELAEEFRLYAVRGGQVFISTHSPDLLNAATAEEVFWITKENGYSTIKRAGEDQQITAFMDEGDKMGYLWKQGFFEGVDPNG